MKKETKKELTKIIVERDWLHDFNADNVLESWSQKFDSEWRGSGNKGKKIFKSEMQKLYSNLKKKDRKKSGKIYGTGIG